MDNPFMSLIKECYQPHVLYKINYAWCCCVWAFSLLLNLQQRFQLKKEKTTISMHPTAESIFKSVGVIARISAIVCLGCTAQASFLNQNPTLLHFYFLMICIIVGLSNRDIFLKKFLDESDDDLPLSAVSTLFFLSALFFPLIIFIASPLLFCALVIILSAFLLALLITPIVLLIFAFTNAW